MLHFIRQHSLLTLLAFAAVFTFLWLLSCRKKLMAKPVWLIILTVLSVAYGVFSVKVFAVLEALSLSGFRNMSLFGVVFLMPLAYWLGAKLTKRSPAVVFDVFVVPMIFTIMCARISCFFTGCCYGRQIPGTQLRWPTREAELVYYVIILSCFLYRSGKGPTDGRLYPVYMISYGAVRFILEFFRFSISGSSPVHLPHFWALLSTTAGIFAYFEISRTGKKQTAGSRRLRKHN